MKSLISRELRCIIWHGLSMMALYAADFTLLNIQKTVISSITDDRPDFNMEGYTLTAIIYSLFTFSLFFVGPYVTYAVGPKLTLFLSSIGMTFFIASYVTETAWVIYLGNVVSGTAQGILWPAEGYYRIQNSSPEHVGRNTSIFWCLFMTSELIGNTCVYFAFKGKMYVDYVTRSTAIYCLVAINLVAVIEFALLPKSINVVKPTDYGPLKTVAKTWKILISFRMMWLIPTFVYAGLQQAFWMGIYGSSLGFSLAFGNSAKEMVALSGICLSIGGVSGGLLPLLLSGWIARERYARRVVVGVGCVAGLCTFLIAYLDVSDDSVFNNTFNQGFIRPPSKALALFGSFTLLFGDSCLNTQIYSYLGIHYRDRSSEACGLYKCIKNLMVSVSFYWCNHLGLHTQLLISTVMAIVGFFTFFMADRDNVPRTPDASLAINSLQAVPKSYDVKDPEYQDTVKKETIVFSKLNE